MRQTIFLRAQHARAPMIKFLGKRSTPKSVDHTPQPHPASPSHSLPDSFANYRSRAQQHGPMGTQGSPNTNGGGGPTAPISANVASMAPYGAIGGTPASRLGSIKPKDGEFWDRSELPKRFARLEWSEAEMDAISTGGASLL